MTIPDSIQSQFLAALEMLRQAIETCPDPLWEDPAYPNMFARVVAHVLFYTHFYLCPGQDHFKPWAKHRKDMEQMKPGCEPFTRVDMLEYLALVRQEVTEKVPSIDLESPSGFHWLPFNRLELHLYNLRHIQQHTGELYERLGAAGYADLGWVSTGKY
jgi:hypothetical protein